MKEEITICVTGGSGFLGSRIVRELCDPSSPVRPSRIVVYDLVPPPEKIAGDVDFVQGDVLDSDLLEQTLSGIDVVFHTAAVVDWGTKPPSEVIRVNVEGTRRVAEACRKKSVRVLVATSSLDATFSGRDLLDVDENLPYPRRHPNAYCRSKMEAELIVKKAHEDGLAACSLRPADIYGEGDPYHIPPLLDMVRSGFYVRIGDGSAKSQHAYVGNVAVAHIQAAASFLNGRSGHGGRSYFITDGPGANFFTFFERIILAAGYRIRPKNLRFPFFLFYLIGAFVEVVTLPVRAVLNQAPRVSRFAAIYTCTSYTFSSKGAERDFGFVPRYSEEEAITATAAFYSEERVRSNR